MSALNDEQYKDFNLHYTPNGLNGPAVLSGYQTIRQALTNILFTDLGSRFFNRSFGCILQSLLFEPMNSDTASNIQMLLSNQIPQLEPRVEFGPFDITVTPIYHDNAYYVVFHMKEKNTNQALKMSTLLEREA